MIRKNLSLQFMKQYSERLHTKFHSIEKNNQQSQGDLVCPENRRKTIFSGRSEQDLC